MRVVGVLTVTTYKQIWWEEEKRKTNFFLKILTVLCCCCCSCRVMFFTQPAHVIMALAVTLVAASMMPSNVKRTSNVTGEVTKPRSFVNFVYLAAFCTHVGAQFWMTFISGKWDNESQTKKTLTKHICVERCKQSEHSAKPLFYSVSTKKQTLQRHT